MEISFSTKVSTKYIFYGVETIVVLMERFSNFLCIVLALAVELPSGSFPCDRRCSLELFSNSFHQASDLRTSHIDRIWHVRYVCNGAGIYH